MLEKEWVVEFIKKKEKLKVQSSQKDRDKNTDGGLWTKTERKKKTHRWWG